MPDRDSSTLHAKWAWSTARCPTWNGLNSGCFTFAKSKPSTGTKPDPTTKYGRRQNNATPVSSRQIAAPQDVRSDSPAARQFGAQPRLLSPPAFVTSHDAMGANARERLRTGVNETRTETS